MTARSSLVREGKIEYCVHLVFDGRGGCRMTRTPPRLGRDERAMALLITLPRALFAVPQLSARIEVADPAAPLPAIDIAAASEALKRAVGCDVDIRITEPVSE